MAVKTTCTRAGVNPSTFHFEAYVSHLDSGYDVHIPNLYVTVFYAQQKPALARQYLDIFTCVKICHTTRMMFIDCHGIYRIKRWTSPPYVRSVVLITKYHSTATTTIRPTAERQTANVIPSTLSVHFLQNLMLAVR